MTTEFATSKDGTRIAYEVSGSGPAVVLVDGALCYREFGPSRDLAAALADSYTVYLYDRRGRGESGDTAPYAPEREFEDLAAVISAAGGNAYVMGQSSGAGIVLEAAASGVAMRKLAVYEAPYVGIRTVKGVERDYLADLETFLAAGKRAKAVDYFMVTMVGGPAFLPFMFRLMPKAFAQLQAVAHTLPYDTRVMSGFVAPSSRLATITVPTLVMGGSKGAAEMKAAVQAVADSVPGSVHRTLAGQTHQVSPAVIAPELKGFFQ
jgi:pimeloyl-ACP methyl ester carboxylesterase